MILTVVVQVAEKLLNRKLSDSEIFRIELEFQKSLEKNTFERCLKSIEKALEINLPTSIRYERRANFSLDSIDGLLLQLRLEAAKWNKENQLDDKGERNNE